MLTFNTMSKRAINSTPELQPITEREVRPKYIVVPRDLSPETHAYFERARKEHARLSQLLKQQTAMYLESVFQTLGGYEADDEEPEKHDEENTRVTEFHLHRDQMVSAFGEPLSYNQRQLVFGDQLEFTPFKQGGIVILREEHKTLVFIMQNDRDAECKIYDHASVDEDRRFCRYIRRRFPNGSTPNRLTVNIALVGREQFAELAANEAWKQNKEKTFVSRGTEIIFTPQVCERVAFPY